MHDTAANHYVYSTYKKMKATPYKCMCGNISIAFTCAI